MLSCICMTFGFEARLMNCFRKFFAHHFVIDNFLQNYLGLIPTKVIYITLELSFDLKDSCIGKPLPLTNSIIAKYLCYTAKNLNCLRKRLDLYNITKKNSAKSEKNLIFQRVKIV